MYGLLLLALIFAAWQAHDLWQSMKDEPVPPAPRKLEPRPAGPRRSTIKQLPYALTSTMPAAQSQPATSMADLLPEPDVEPIPANEDPVGVAPPDGAVRGKAHRMPDGSVVAKYEWVGLLAEALRHYQDRFGEAGCKLLDSSVDEQGRHYLSFQGASQRYVVALRSAGPEAKMVSIEVTVIPLSK